MAWITPITNWIASNVLSPSDMNRIEGNTQDLKDNKVDKVAGKQLSTEDYTTGEKNKLLGIEAGASYVPTGAIVMWSGSYTNIPTGWSLCNGANGTPDLRDRFVMGAISSVDHKTTGGANSIVLSTTQLPSHTHTPSLSSDGEHSHLFRWNTTRAQSSGYFAVGSSDWDTNYSKTSTASVVSAGAHTHSITIGNTGSGDSVDNRPAFYKLAFIMKM